MNYIVFLVLLMCASMVVSQRSAPLHLPYLQFIPLKSVQFMAQNSDGRISFGYAGDNQFRSESRSEDGSVQGVYSYIDPTNRLVRVVYVADGKGYRVVEANNLPTVSNTIRLTNETPEAAVTSENEKSDQKVVTRTVPESRRKRDVLMYSLDPPFVSPSTSLKVKPLEGVTSPADTMAVEYSGVDQAVALTPLAVLTHPRYLFSANV